MADNRLAPASKNNLPWYEQALPMEGRATFLPFQDTLPGSVMNQRSFALPGVIAGAVNAFTAPGRAYRDPNFNPEEEAANFAMTMGGGGMGASRLAPAPRNALGMNVYHGTPHRFPPTAKNPLGEFDPTKIGTGEGAQAYGRGTYLAEAKRVAESYKTAGNASYPEVYIGGRKIDPKHMTGKKGDWGPDAMDFEEVLGSKFGEITGEKAKQLILNSGADANVKASLAKLPSDQFKVTRSQGNLYKVDLPDEIIAKMLVWDKPLSEQPEILAKVLANPQWRRRLENRTDEEVGTMFGKDLYGMGHDQTAALGIPGIRYLDANSRAGEAGTSNFVVFDPTRANILEREAK